MACSAIRMACSEVWFIRGSILSIPVKIDGLANKRRSLQSVKFVGGRTGLVVIGFSQATECFFHAHSVRLAPFAYDFVDSSE